MNRFNFKKLIATTSFLFLPSFFSRFSEALAGRPTCLSFLGHPGLHHVCRRVVAVKRPAWQVQTHASTLSNNIYNPAKINPLSISGFEYIIGYNPTARFYNFFGIWGYLIKSIIIYRDLLNSFFRRSPLSSVFFRVISKAHFHHQPLAPTPHDVALWPFRVLF